MKLKKLGVPSKKDQKFPERFTAPEFSALPLDINLIGEENAPDSGPETGTDGASALSDELDLLLPDEDADAGDADDSTDATT